MHRLPLVGRIRGLSLTAQELSFTLRSKFHGADIDYRCHTSRPEILAIAESLEPGQLVGMIGVAPDHRVADGAPGFTIERLEVMGRAVDVAACGDVGR